MDKQYTIMEKTWGGDDPFRPSLSFPFDELRHAEKELDRLVEAFGRHRCYQMFERVVSPWAEHGAP